MQTHKNICRAHRGSGTNKHEQVTLLRPRLEEEQEQKEYNTLFLIVFVGWNLGEDGEYQTQAYNEIP